MRRFTVPFPLVLLLLAVLAFGLLIPQLGFYWDDWAKLLAGRLFGLDSYPAYYAEDRPLSAWTHMLFTPVLGYAPFGWHVLTLLLRWLSAWAAYWTLNLIWPRARWQNAVAAALFLVYPVFTQQPAAVTFHQQWLQYALFLFSLGAMVKAARSVSPSRRRLWTAAGLAAVILHFSVTEYFIPVEILRIAILVILVRQGVFAPKAAGVGGSAAGEPAAASGVPAASGEAVTAGVLPAAASTEARRAARWGTGWPAAFRAYAPYGVLLAAYAVYRLFIYVPPAGSDPYRAETLFNFAADPLGTLRGVGLAVLVDEIRILVTSWADLLQIEIAGAAPFTLFSYALGLAGGALLALYLLRAPQSAPDGAAALWTRQAAALGLLGVLLGPVPAWITGRQVVFDFHSDRYALPAMFGAALLFAAGIEWLGKARLQKAVLAGMLAALALGLHLRAANDYRWIWTDQTRFYWQLHWRAPGLEPPTLILSETEPFPNQGLFSTSAALNLLYPQTAAALDGQAPLGTWIYTLLPRFKDGLPAGPAQSTFSTSFRTLRFEGRLSQALVIHRDPRFANCLWVLRPEDAAHPYLPPLVREFLPVSNLNRIRPEPAPGYPPPDLFGPAPEQEWCYYYEKAELARQLGDWPTGAALYDAARAAGYAPGRSQSKSPYEWRPMIEALRASGRAAEAAELTTAALQADPDYRALLCAVWEEDAGPDWHCAAEP